MTKNTTKSGTGFNQELLEKYLALENSPIFQDMLAVTIEQYLPDLRNKKAYDVGFGTGFCLKLLLNKGLLSYTGLDLNTDWVPYLEQKIQAETCATKVNFVQGDATKDIKLVNAPFDFVISSFAMYVNSNEKLSAYTKHLSNAVKDDGTLFLMVYHADFIYERSRINILEDEYNHYILPKLSDGARHQEFSKINVILKPPYFFNEINMEEYVVSNETLHKSLRESGFSKLVTLDMYHTPGKEKLLDLARAFGIHLYKCSK